MKVSCDRWRCHSTHFHRQLNLLTFFLIFSSSHSSCLRPVKPLPMWWQWNFLTWVTENRNNLLRQRMRTFLFPVHCSRFSLSNNDWMWFWQLNTFSSRKKRRKYTLYNFRTHLIRSTSMYRFQSDFHNVFLFFGKTGKVLVCFPSDFHRYFSGCKFNEQRTSYTLKIIWKLSIMTRWINCVSISAFLLTSSILFYEHKLFD